jgi:hypothetical protein
MNSSLLNVWRENGAYLRFADSKNALLTGISLALLLTYTNFVLITDSHDWFSLIALWGIASISPLDCVVFGCFLASAFLSGISIVPTLTKSSVRTNLFISLARHFSVIKLKNQQGTIYFLDVAAYPTAIEYQKRLLNQLREGTVLTSADKDLVAQIWIVSRIASSKHFIFLFSASLAIVGVFLSLFS